MDGRHSRALAVGLVFGVLLTGCNLFAYLYYQKQMDDYWTSGASRLYDNLCVGVDTFFYLILPTAIVYFAAGVCCVAYARRHLERRAHAATAAALAGLATAILSVAATGLLIVSGLFSTGVTYGGWIIVYGMYSLGGVFIAVIGGAVYYDHVIDKEAVGRL